MNSKDNFSPESENQLNKVFPQIVLRFGEIHLRPLSLDDQAPMAISANDPDIQRWLPLPFPYTESHANSLHGKPCKFVGEGVNPEAFNRKWVCQRY
jgi:hypothetical protein